ncbi:MAG: glycosyltransferase [Myxococcota bacterium]|nr:glycosyltransferase [Myxococcota bacterium]
MNFTVFGLSITSSWGNGHATLWRGLCGALGSLGHHVVFFERDTPYYASHRDGTSYRGCDVRLYSSWAEVAATAAKEVARADVAMVTSYCPDAKIASDLVRARCAGVRTYYDLDTPVTLGALDAGEAVPYLPDGGLSDFDIVLSFTGGPALDALQSRLGARSPRPLYGSVDPGVHRPAAPSAAFEADLAYLGTYAADRRSALDELFVQPARRAPRRKFLLGGALYPDGFPDAANVRVLPHVPASDHGAFFSSCALSLNVTRGAMARWGWSPSGRLFEAAACGAPQITDVWDGLESFFRPGEEILLARSSSDVLAALELPRGDLERMARAARERVLTEHSASARARELVGICSGSVRMPGGHLSADEVPTQRSLREESGVS